MAAALRVLRCLRDASPAHLLPSPLPGPCPNLYDAAAATASGIQSTRGVQSSPVLVPSMLRRYCSGRGGGDAAASIQAMRRAHASPLQVPFPVRHHGSTKDFSFLEQYREEEILEYLLENMVDLKKKKVAALREKVAKLKTMVPADCSLDDDDDVASLIKSSVMSSVFRFALTRETDPVLES